MVEDEYKSIKVKVSTYEKLKKLAGEKPLTRFLDDVAEQKILDMDKAVKEADKFLKQIEEYANLFAIQPVHVKIKADELKDGYVKLTIVLILQIGNEALKEKILEVYGRGVER